MFMEKEVVGKNITEDEEMHLMQTSNFQEVEDDCQLDFGG